MYRFLTAVHDTISLRKIAIWEQTQGRKRGIHSPAAPRARCPPCCRLWAAVWPCGRRWGTDTPQPIWTRVGELFGAPKAKQEKGAASWTPPPRSLLPAVRAVAPFRHRRRRREFSEGGGVENRNDPAVARKAAGSWQKFKEESRDDK